MVLQETLDALALELESKADIESRQSHVAALVLYLQPLTATL